MKKLLMIPVLFSMAACSSSHRAPASKLNCEKLEKDSDAKLIELQKVFAAYQEINYDLAVKFAPSLREETDILETRIKRLKARCWPGESKAVDNEMASLKSELTKVYGLEPEAPKKRRIPASRRSSLLPAAGTPSEAEMPKAPAAISDLTPESSSPAVATPSDTEGDQN
jgi:hypothetical protein